MLPEITLPNGRRSTALAFGCASLLRLPEVSEHQRLLDQAVDLGIRHFDVARLYGLGMTNVETTPLNFGEDKLAELARSYRERGGGPSHDRYGFVRTA